MCQVKPKLSKPALTLLIRTVLLCPCSKCIRLTLLKASRGKTAFSLMPLFWTGFRLITMGMAKNGVLKQFFLFSRMRMSLFCQRISFFFFLALFSPFSFLFYFQFCCPLYRLSFTWNCGWLASQERDKFNLQRVVLGKQGNCHWIFFEMLFGFIFVTLSGLVRNCKGEVSVELIYLC